MWALALTSIVHRTSAFIAVFLAALLGSTLLLVAGSFFETGIRLSAPTTRFTESDMLVMGAPDYVMLTEDGSESTDLRPFPERHRVEESAVDSVAGVNGVESASAVLLIDAQIGVENGQVRPVTVQNSASAAAGPFAEVEGVLPRNDSSIAISESLAEDLSVGVGQQLQLTLAGTASDYTIDGVVGAAASPDAVFVTEGTARQAARSPLIDAVHVELEQGADAGRVREDIHKTLSGVVVLEGPSKGAAEDNGVFASRLPAIVTGAVFAGIVLVVLATVISGTVSLSVHQRARELSLLRATGATGRQAWRMTVIETMVVGCLGVLVGVVVGIPTSHAVFSTVSSLGLFAPSLRLEVGLIPAAAAITAPVIVLFLAAASAARPVRRARAIDALREADVAPRRLGIIRFILGVIFALGAIALAIISRLMPPALITATSGPAVLAGSISAALLAPMWLRAVNGLVRRPVRGAFGSLGSVASDSVRIRAAQLGAVTACVALVIGIGVGNLASQNLQQNAATTAAVAPLRGDVVLHVQGRAAEIADRAANLPAVEAAGVLVSSGGWIEEPYDASHPDRPWTFTGISSAAVLDYTSKQGSLDDLTGKTLALPAHIAEQMGVAVGHEVRVRFGDGAAEALRVVATFDDRVGYERVLMPADLLAGHTTTRAASTVLVAAAEGVSPADLDSALREAFAADGLVDFVNPREIGRIAAPGSQTQVIINGLMVAITVAYAAIAVINTLSVTILSRRRELALIRLSGATRRQVMRILTIESAILAVTGAVLGLVVSLGAIVPSALVVGESPVSAGTGWVVGAFLIAVAVLVVPVTFGTGRRATRGRPAADSLAPE
ncbi:hypothetical protein AUC47_00310 [Microbacterium sp. SZ1]|uniref:FtsX-like permease family protein n=1 Tax=Microbacterium sp. SZ1 TaxID=1849736 RepID=UPI000BBB76E1|nr:FtsX-like permease family protein [Microbacterium sp. SZ1]PCE16333.1 hypothetical protein AUC47_00310 [Microbacterium sp. SZ1]